MLVLSLAGIGKEAWATNSTVAFDLPAGDLSKMILEFGQQAHVKVWYDSRNGSVQGLMTHAVSGTLSISDALARMLEGTACTWAWESENSVVVHVNPEAPGANTEKPNSADNPAGSAAGQEEERTDLTRLDADSRDLQEVLVTGTHLRGVTEGAAPMVRLRGQQLNRTGYATAEAAIDTLPMNFYGGARDDFGNSMTGNFNHGQAPNLRGLGAGATLVLVNGRRQPASGTDGSFVDISTVPVSAIERIDVMPDGASALYGSDAIAGVVNIILRQDLEGAETRTRVATVQGGANEALLAQLATEHWDGGQALFAYQFSKRESLPISARAYARNSDKRAFGGEDFRSVLSNPGNILDPRTLLPAYAIPANQDGVDLKVSDLQAGQINLQSLYQGVDLLPDRTTHSFYVTASHRLSPTLEVFADTRYSDREGQQTLPASHSTLTVPASNAYYLDPFRGSPYVLVDYNFYDDLGPASTVGRTETSFSTLGIRTNLSGNWRAVLSGSFGREYLHWDASNIVDASALASALADSNPATAFNPFGAGSHTARTTLDSIRATQRERTTSTIAYAELVADGPLVRLPAGAVKVALGLGARQEHLFPSQGLGMNLVGDRYARQNGYTFGELSLPIAPRLEMSVAGRYERYSDFGSTLNKKVGVSWAANESFRARGSWGTSFRAPLLVNLDEKRGTAAGFLQLSDPRSPTGQSFTLAVQGNNAHLKQETGNTWTTGVDFAMPGPPGFTVSLTYFSIDYRDRIAQPNTAGSLFQILYEENRWGAPVIIRHPSRAQVDPLCAIPLFFGSRADCFSQLPDVIVDVRLRNLASTTEKGIDAALAQTFTLTTGQLRWTLDGTYLLHFDQAVTSASPAVSLLDTVNNPLAVRAFGALDWYQHGENLPGLGASLTAHYAGSYSDNRSVPNRRIAALTTFDLQMTYRTPKGTRLLDDIEVACGAVNLFNREPPFVNEALGYDQSNAEPTGRMLTVFAQKNW